MTYYHELGEEESIQIDPKSIGIEQSTRATPIPKDLATAGERADNIANPFNPDDIARAAAEAGLAALGGEKGTTYDSLVYSGAIVLNHLGRAGSLAEAADKIRQVLDSGEALQRFNAAA
jgi:anthranilate phosphoribosyltransferase